MQRVKEESLSIVEGYSESIDKAVDSIIAEYSRDLDCYMKSIDAKLVGGKNISDGEIDNIALNLSSLIYFTSVGCEALSIRDDISKTIYKEAYNKARSELKSGTVADKNTQAELNTLEEHIGNVVYNKSYKSLKAKVDSAQEMLATVKKIMSRRIAEMELSRMQVNK